MRNLLLLSLLFSPLGHAETSCFYPSKTNDYSFQKSEQCGAFSNGLFHISNAVFDDISFSNSGPACILINKDQLYFVNKDRRSIQTILYDNGCDKFQEELARGVNSGKHVYVNEKLEVVLEPGFEKLSQYSYGHAVVCNGPFIEEAHGEHTFFTGGSCGLLDNRGNLVVTAEHNIEDRTVFEYYINSHNHCSPPPVTKAEVAICHAKRHIDNSGHDDPDWSTVETTRLGSTWIITYENLIDNRRKFTLQLGRESAHWESIIAENHEAAINRVKNATNNN